MAIDKNQAVIEFLTTYPDMQSIPLFFNFINAKDNNIQFLTESNDVTLDKTFIDGSVLRRYEFTLVITKSITDLAMVKPDTSNEDIWLSNENIEDMADIQNLMDWINEQGDARNYPNFGEDCVVENLHTLTNNPTLEGVNTDVTPALAMYSMSIGIDYIDYSKTLWK